MFEEVQPVFMEIRTPVPLPEATSRVLTFYANESSDQIQLRSGHPG